MTYKKYLISSNFPKISNLQQRYRQIQPKVCMQVCSLFLAPDNVNGFKIFDFGSIFQL